MARCDWGHLLATVGKPPGVNPSWLRAGGAGKPLLPHTWPCHGVSGVGAAGSGGVPKSPAAPGTPPVRGAPPCCGWFGVPDAHGVCALPWGSAFLGFWGGGCLLGIFLTPFGTPTAEPTPRPGAAPREEEAAEGDLQEGAAAGDVLGEALRPARPPPGLLGVPSPPPRSAFVPDAAWFLGPGGNSTPKSAKEVPGGARI